MEVLDEFFCGFCSESFGSEIDERRHQLIHFGKNLFKCDNCDYEARDVYDLKIHQLTHSNDTPLFQCESCKKEYLSESALRNHKCFQTAFKCGVCNYGADKKCELSSHMLTHSNGKPFKCFECNFSSKYVRAVKNHIAFKHSDDRPFRCSYCEAAFKNKRNWKIHLRIHTGEKPYKCLHCDFAANQKHCLTAHVKRWHSDAGNGTDSLPVHTSTASNLLTNSHQVGEYPSSQEHIDVDQPSLETLVLERGFSSTSPSSSQGGNKEHQTSVSAPPQNSVSSQTSTSSQTLPQSLPEPNSALPSTPLAKSSLVQEPTAQNHVPVATEEIAAPVSPPLSFTGFAMRCRACSTTNQIPIEVWNLFSKGRFELVCKSCGTSLF